MAYQDSPESATSSPCTLQSSGSSVPGSPLESSISSLECVCEPKDAFEAIVQHIEGLYRSLAAEPDLTPCPRVNDLFTELVSACLDPSWELSAIPVLEGSRSLQFIPHLRQLCSTGEAALERYWAEVISNTDCGLHVFPYHSNYESITKIEASLIRDALSMGHSSPKHIAFVGSGPLPLTTVLLAQNHFPSTNFINIDCDSHALAVSQSLVRRLALDHRMRALHADGMCIEAAVLGTCDVVYLAALVGMSTNEKQKLVESISRKLRPDCLLVARSAHGLRTLLYPVLDVEDLNLTKLRLELVTQWIPQDNGVVNSVLIFRRI